MFAAVRVQESTENRERERLTQDGEEDVDEEVSTAATLEEDTQRREDDGKDDLADVAIGTVLLAIRMIR